MYEVKLLPNVVVSMDMGGMDMLFISRSCRNSLESAPVPATRDAGGDLGALGQHSGQGRLRILVRRDIRAVGGGIVFFIVTVRGSALSIEQALDLAQALGTRLLPALVGAPAEVACAGGYSIGVEASILIKRDDMRSVGGAEDMAAMATVVATKKETERGAAGRRVAVGGSRVRLLGGFVSTRSFLLICKGVCCKAAWMSSWRSRDIAQRNNGATRSSACAMTTLYSRRVHPGAKGLKKLVSLTFQ